MNEDGQRQHEQQREHGYDLPGWGVLVGDVDEGDHDTTGRKAIAAPAQGSSCPRRIENRYITCHGQVSQYMTSPYLQRPVTW